MVSSKPSRRICLDQHAELEFAAAGDLEGVGFGGVGDLDGDIAFGLAEQPVADLAGGDLLAFAAGQRAVIDAEGHGQGRRVDRGGGQRGRHFRRADGFRDGGVGQPGHGDDIAGAHLIDRDALQAAEGEQLGQAAGFDHLAVEVADLDRHVQRGPALLDAAGEHAAEEGVGLQDGGDHAERRGDVQIRGRDMAQDEVEQRVQVLARVVEFRDGPALAARGEEHREVELLLVGTQRGEQVEHLVMDVIRAGVATVDLVDHHDRLQAAGQRLAEHEFGLRQHALGGVDQDDGAVDHVQDALDLAAEIGVAGGVDDVDAHVVPDHRGDFGQNGDAALFFQVVAVQRALGHRLVGGIGAGLLQQLVGQGGFAMVDVGDDGDIADFRRGHERIPTS